MPGSRILLSQALLSRNSCKQRHLADILPLNQINHKLLKGKHCVSLVIPIKTIPSAPTPAVGVAPRCYGEPSWQDAHRPTTWSYSTEGEHRGAQNFMKTLREGPPGSPALAELQTTIRNL